MPLVRSSDPAAIRSSASRSRPAGTPRSRRPSGRRGCGRSTVADARRLDRRSPCRGPARRRRDPRGAGGARSRGGPAVEVAAFETLAEIAEGFVDGGCWRTSASGCSSRGPTANRSARRPHICSTTPSGSSASVSSSLPSTRDRRGAHAPRRERVRGSDRSRVAAAVRPRSPDVRASGVPAGVGLGGLGGQDV